MRQIRTPEEMAACAAEVKRSGRTIGFVPTMGALHEGHLTLVRQARMCADFVVVSIFVNPAQFGPNEDFASYPRDIEGDLRLLNSERVDAVFFPTEREMYPEGYRTWVDVGGLSEKLEGRFRPGHFRGVCTIVLKLFCLVLPDAAFFGWKDAQQFIIIRRMATDLNLPVRIVGVPTWREPDGLAGSSRNRRLSDEHRRHALCLSRALHFIREKVSQGETDTESLLARARRIIAEEPGVVLQYLDIVDIEQLDPVARVVPGTMAAGAILVGGVRLIDNVVFPADEPTAGRKEG